MLSVVDQSPMREGSTAGIVLHDSGGNAWDIFNSGNDLKFNVRFFYYGAETLERRTSC